MVASGRGGRSRRGKRHQRRRGFRGGHGVLDLDRWFLHNRSMPRTRRRWTAIACFAAWAVGPAVGIAIAAHELEHHGEATHEHSHAAQAAAAFLHGHVHEEDADDHVHDLAPPSVTPSRMGNQARSAAAVAPPRSVGAGAGLSHVDGPAPEANALAPPALYGLCVLRL